MTSRVPSFLVRIVLIILLGLSAGCTSADKANEDKVQRLLAKGDYRGAISVIECGPRSAEGRFSLGMLYAYRELDEKGEKADFTQAVELIRSAAPDSEGAREFMADYERRGAQLFYAFPWTHLVGPFRKLNRPQPATKPV